MARVWRPPSTFLLTEKRRTQNLSPNQVRLLSASRGMLGDVEPDLQYVACRYTVLQNNPAKHRFVVPGNLDIDVRIPIHPNCGESQLLENPWFNTLYIKVGLHGLHEP